MSPTSTTGAATRHLIDLLGVDHVAIGTDRNGVSGYMDGYRGEHDLAVLTRALLERAGLDVDATTAVLGGNARRALEAAAKRVPSRRRAATSPDDPAWYQRAVFYEVLVRGFMRQRRRRHRRPQRHHHKLDYLAVARRRLPVAAALLPVALRDGGYDISDFFSVLPAYGDVDDAARLIEETHRRGMRVIADMVMNHTHDQHPWFQESRQDRTNPKADWYVWATTTTSWWPRPGSSSSTPSTSNWTYDQQRGQYYWHRFFHHQPDLNYDNPEVAEAMLDVVRFWLNLGLDGFRLDAVPYLFERDGTNGENLPETHEYLRRVRKAVDAEFPARCCSPRRTSGPPDVVDYFGDGDECHMCFHFPLMPRMFMARARGEQRLPDHRDPGPDPGHPPRLPVGHLPPQPRRAHPRDGHRRGADYMYTEYAKDPLMRRNVGICPPPVPADRERPGRRRALPRHAVQDAREPGACTTATRSGWATTSTWATATGVRTPMQWTPDRNAGFSRADFAQLYLPPLMDPVYGYQATNVEAAAARPELVPALGPAHARGPQAAPGARPSAPSRCSRPRTRRCSPTCAEGSTSTRTGRRTSCCACTTSAASPNRPSSSWGTWPASSPHRADRPACRSRSSASCPTSSPSRPTGSSGSASVIRRTTNRDATV